MEKKAIAIFEDDEANRFIYRKSLKSWDSHLEVHYFDSIEQWELVTASKQFDVVLIDVHFKGRSFEGVRLLRKLRQTGRHDWPAIGFMPFIQYGDVRRLQALGFKVCLEKPHWVFNMQVIMDLLNSQARDNSNIKPVPVL